MTPSTPAFLPGHDSQVSSTNSATIPNAPCPAEGSESFSNPVFWSLIVASPLIFTRIAIPIITLGFWHPSISIWAFLLLFPFTGLPTAIGYWTFMSIYAPRINNKAKLPTRPLTDYITIKDPDLSREYAPSGRPTKKIPMQVCHDAYFDGKIDFKAPPGQTEPDLLSVLEYRYDWADFRMTPTLFKQVFTQLIPEVIFHTSNYDEGNVSDIYNRGNDFFEWFLGPSMVYTCGLIGDESRFESLEELQENKFKILCHKLDLQPTDKVLDIGCGWGTLTAYAAKNYGCDVTGVTIAKEQAEFGNDRLRKNGISEDRARVLQMDFYDLPAEPAGRYNKIVSVEMAEHIGIIRYNGFLKRIYNLLEDDGVFILQVAGLRANWQYHDLIWGLFMNKYIFPGADASCSLGWVMRQVESAGFEVKNVDTLGPHYCATVWRWYLNWVYNKDKAVAKYGERTFRIMSYFLASSTIVAREGGSSAFQITMHKNLNATKRINNIKSHTSIHFTPKADLQSLKY